MCKYVYVGKCYARIKESIKGLITKANINNKANQVNKNHSPNHAEFILQIHHLNSKLVFRRFNNRIISNENKNVSFENERFIDKNADIFLLIHFKIAVLESMGLISSRLVRGWLINEIYLKLNGA